MQPFQFFHAKTAFHLAHAVLRDHGEKYLLPDTSARPVQALFDLIVFAVVQLRAEW